VAVEHGLHCFLQQRLPELGIGLDARLDQVVEAAGERHGPLPSFWPRFARLVIQPEALGRRNIATLTLLGSSKKQNDDPVAVSSKIEAVAGTPIQLQLENTFADAGDIRDIAAL